MEQFKSKISKQFSVFHADWGRRHRDEARWRVTTCNAPILVVGHLPVSSRHCLPYSAQYSAFQWDYVYSILENSMTPASFKGPVWCSLICFDAVCTNHTMWDTNQAAFQSPGKKRRVTKRRTTNNQACNNSLLACCRRFQHTHQREHTHQHTSAWLKGSETGVRLLV